MTEKAPSGHHSLNIPKEGMGTFKRLMTTAFLRIYAFSMGRIWRNSPRVACSDAILTMSMLCALLMAPIVYLVVALTGPTHLVQFVHSEVISYGVGCAVVLPVVYWLSKTFSRFADTPELAEPYMAPRARRISFVGMILTAAISMAAIAIVALVTP